MSHQTEVLTTAKNVARHIGLRHELEAYSAQLVDEIAALILRFEVRATRDTLEKQRHQEVRDHDAAVLDEIRKRRGKLYIDDHLQNAHCI